MEAHKAIALLGRKDDQPAQPEEQVAQSRCYIGRQARGSRCIGLGGNGCVLGKRVTRSAPLAIAVLLLLLLTILTILTVAATIVLTILVALIGLLRVFIGRRCRFLWIWIPAHPSALTL